MSWRAKTFPEIRASWQAHVQGSPGTIDETLQWEGDRERAREREREEVMTWQKAKTLSAESHSSNWSLMLIYQPVPVFKKKEKKNSIVIVVL